MMYWPSLPISKILSDPDSSTIVISMTSQRPRKCVKEPDA